MLPLMTTKRPNSRPEEIELRSDGWERFEKAVDAAVPTPAKSSAAKSAKKPPRGALKSQLGPMTVRKGNGFAPFVEVLRARAAQYRALAEHATDREKATEYCWIADVIDREAEAMERSFRKDRRCVRLAPT